jgi:ribosomal-protein-alanine N-acetyltransferase
VPRPLQSADLDRVVAIERSAFSDPWSKRAFVELLAQPHVRSFAIDGDDARLAGYAFCAVAADQGEILNLAVDQHARRIGLGRALLDAVLQAMRREGVATVFLEVRQSNEAAIRLYTRAGFRSVSMRRAYYSHPTEHALSMALDLPQERAEKR